MKIEKRRNPRTLIKIQVDYASEGAYLYDYSRDLSEGGIFIQTTNPKNIGDRIQLKFILPELLEEIKALGEVAWVNQKDVEGLTPGMGVRFINLDKEKSALIQDVIARIEGGKKKTSLDR